MDGGSFTPSLSEGFESTKEASHFQAACSNPLYIINCIILLFKQRKHRIQNPMPKNKTHLDKTRNESNKTKTKIKKKILSWEIKNHPLHLGTCLKILDTQTCREKKMRSLLTPSEQVLQYLQRHQLCHSSMHTLSMHAYMHDIEAIQ